MKNPKRVSAGKVNIKKRWEAFDFEKAFWNNVSPPDSNGCRKWNKITNKFGYGKASFHSKTIGAHRLAYMFSKGPIPKGMCICHICDNRICCEPSHLFVGTLADNVKDCISKGRRYNKKGSQHFMYGKLRGENNPSCKLTKESVEEIRSMYKSGSHLQHALAHKFHVSQSSISRIILNQTWVQKVPESNPA